MFTRFSIRQVLIAIAVLALVFAAFGTGMSSGSPFATGLVYASLTMPFLFLLYALMVLLMRILAPIGIALFGPIKDGDGPKRPASHRTKIAQEVPLQSEHANIE